MYRAIPSNACLGKTPDFPTKILKNWILFPQKKKKMFFSLSFIENLLKNQALADNLLTPLQKMYLIHISKIYQNPRFIEAV